VDVLEVPAPSRGEPRTFRVIALASDPIVQQGGDSVPDGIGGYAYEGAPLDRVPELSNRGSIASIQERLYPRLLKDAGVGGTVVVRFVVEEDGTVDPRTAKLVENTHPDLVDPTLKALERFRFRPARLAGRNVRVFFSMPVRWDPAATAPVAVAMRAPEGATRTTVIGESAIAAPVEVNRGALATQAVRTAQAVQAARVVGKPTIIARAAVLIAQKYPSLLAETEPANVTLFIIASPTGEIQESRLVRKGEDFSWPAGTPTAFERIVTVRDLESLEFAPALVGSGIVWMEL
jgi:TonB family protein